MLANESATPMLAVKDLARARKFYEGTLGLTPVGSEGEEVIVFKSGDSTINVYRSQYAGTNEATALTWTVGDVDATVRELKDKGVSFEHYDLPDTKREGDIHVGGDLKVAWFKDPDGNILSIVNDYAHVSAHEHVHGVLAVTLLLRLAVMSLSGPAAGPRGRALPVRGAARPR